MEEKSRYHEPVLLQEVIEALAIRPDGMYVDCTFGGGGHAKAILSRLGQQGRLVAFDQDAAAQNNAPADPRLLFVPQNFRHLQRFLRLHKTVPVDGVLADLGVSSHQLDQADRGFSTRFDADLDMRMDQRQALTAYHIVQTYPEEKLHRMFEQYGEVTNAKTLAYTIVAARRVGSLQTVSNFKTALYQVVKGNPHRYFAQVFQALRIEVNDELGALRELLQQLPQVLKPGGRAAIITFHSLEDRMVKNYFKRGSEEAEQDNPFERGTRDGPVLQPLLKKPVVPGEPEQKRNPRAGSAKLRVAVKL